MKYVRSATAAMLLLVTCLTLTGDAMVVPLDTQQLTEGAALVVHGAVVDQHVHYVDDERGQMIVTDYTVTVIETLYSAPGAQIPRQITVQVEGGQIGKVGMMNHEAPTITLGEQVALFLRPHHFTPDAWDVYGAFQGKLTILEGQVREANDVSWSDLRTEILGHAAEKK